MLGRQLDTGITNFDDAFYAQKAKEIYESGNLWIITHGGTPSFENPPSLFGSWLWHTAYLEYPVFLRFFSPDYLEQEL